MNYRRIVRRLMRKYPSIAQELSPVPAAKSEQLPGYFSKYISVTADLPAWITTNTRGTPTLWNEPRTMFLAVMIRLVDPLYFEDPVYIDRGFVSAMSDVLGCKGTQIIYTLRKARNFYEVYPDFHRKVDAIFEKMTAE